MKSSRPARWPWIILALVALSMVGLVGLVLIAATVGGGTTGRAAVGVIDLAGVISDDPSGILGSSPAGKFIEQVEQARRDSSVKAVVIRINSPGGSAAASQEMYQAVVRLRNTGKPVICSMSDVAASGGYYVASACDHIFANAATLTGSIGVISQFMSFQQILGKVGVTPETIKSGQFKDAGSPMRSMTPAERQLFQAMIMDVYSQFVDDVTAGRKKPTQNKLTRAQVQQLADGRVYTGRQAKAALLIDEIGGLHEAVAYAAQKGAVKGDPPSLRHMGAAGLLDSMLGAQTESRAMAGAAGAAAGKAFADAMTAQLSAAAHGGGSPQARY